MTDPSGATLEPEAGRVAEVVRALEALSLASEDGASLGAEDALLARFGVSRPTLRQALRIALTDGMVTVRRGLRGGVYAARPSAATAIRAPARYLRLHDATLAHVQQVGRAIAPEIAALAIVCADEGLRDELRALAAELDGRDGGSDTVRMMIESEGRFGSLLARMTGNPVMVLLNQIFFAFGGLERDLKFYRTAKDRKATRKLQLELIQAVLARDEEAARATARQRIALVASWVD